MGHITYQKTKLLSQEIPAMSAISKIIWKRLSKRGLSNVEINKLITDSFNTTFNKKNLSIPAIQKTLNDLGWGEQFIDSHTLGLIFLYLEEADSLQAVMYSMHKQMK